ncbi:hypothetical protein [Leucobacter tenebrionis]|uniref:hypothetical protein n=1 Tax=Leucobacter tenebrionis TaxID=2873270 RepID=UPI001CA610C5|nr:hypothetical protein [Leucobacter tenebrionis]QZY52908.1 hypothetical protein KVY00_05595 [Leucobacter tenebrionis]
MFDNWAAWLKWHLDQVPFQILHMRELVENTIKAQDTEAVRVSGGSDPARLPYNATAADDADALYVELVLFAREVADRTGLPSPRPVRTGLWQGRYEPQGLPSCRPDEAYAWASEIRTWLVTLLPDLEQLAADGKLGDAPDHLAASVRKMRGRYPRAEPKFKAYRPRPCPIPACGESTIAPVYDAEGLAGYRCDTCEAQWDRAGAPVEKIPIRERDSP